MNEHRVDVLDDAHRRSRCNGAVTFHHGLFGRRGLVRNDTDVEVVCDESRLCRLVTFLRDNNAFDAERPS